MKDSVFGTIQMQMERLAESQRVSMVVARAEAERLFRSVIALQAEAERTAQLLQPAIAAHERSWHIMDDASRRMVELRDVTTRPERAPSMQASRHGSGYQVRGKVPRFISVEVEAEDAADRSRRRIGFAPWEDR